MEHGSSGLPVRALAVDIIEGPERGGRISTDDDTLTVGTADGNVLVLSDETVSGYHLELGRAPDGVRVTDLGSTNGTRVGVVRVRDAVVPAGTVLELGATKLRIAEGQQTTVAVHQGDSLAGIHGSTPEMRRLMAQVQKAAGADVAVLLTGESGTGKELIARALHDLGPRARGAFVTVDCGSLAPTLVASELFGHERGAFTGADKQHVGAFERAQGGTIFLDEVGELPAPLQATLLGVLERRRFRRLGGSVDVDVDVRVVSATHRDLRAAINAGSYRLDLFYRLAVVTLRVPPLRDRPGDVPVLVEHFLRACGHEGPVSTVLPDEAMALLRQHSWPGNVRELRNFVEATLAMGEAPELFSDVGPGEGRDPIAALLHAPWKEARGALLRQLEERYLPNLLERAEGNVSRAARLAKMDRSYLIELLRRHGLK